jgi:hypothetical protein
MEIILISLTLLTLITLVIIVGTRGNPLSLFYQFQSFKAQVVENKIQLLLLSSLILLVSLFAYFFYIMPQVTAGPLQPIPFSHRLHAGNKKIDCRFCHSYVDRSIHPGIPPVEKCLYCHNFIISNHPEIRKEHNYFDTKTPTPWKKVFYVPEHVMFNHERHIKKEVECETCHGDIEGTDRLKTHEFIMGFCIKCHRKEKANLDCWLSCHN